MLLFRLQPIVLLCAIGAITAAHAQDAEIWNSHLTRSWLDSNLALASDADGKAGLTRTRIWASGIKPTTMSAFAATASDKTVGANVKPFGDYDFRVGTELTDSPSNMLASKVNWEASWSRGWEDIGGLKVGVNTSGSVGNYQTSYAQSVGGSVGLPILKTASLGSTELRLSPNMNVDTLNGAVGTSLTSEIVSQKILSARNDEFKSVLNMKVGYDMAPETRPAGIARLELRISPNIR